MSAKVCIVSVETHVGGCHSVRVTAESLYEAVAEAAALLQEDKWVGGIGPATRFCVEVRQPSVRHLVSMVQISRWLEGAPKSPNELVRKERLKKLLDS